MCSSDLGGLTTYFYTTDTLGAIGRSSVNLGRDAGGRLDSITVGPDRYEFDLDADGLLARVVQHEMDHLDGLLFVDRISVEDRISAEAELRKRLAGTLGTSDPFLTGKAIKALLRKHV